jgi:hypothetical protein
MRRALCKATQDDNARLVMALQCGFASANKIRTLSTGVDTVSSAGCGAMICVNCGLQKH